MSVKKFFGIICMLSVLALTGCRKSVDLAAVTQQVTEHFDLLYGQGNWQADVRLSAGSPLLGEVAFPDSSVYLISINPRKSKVVDYLPHPVVYLRSDTLPLSADLSIRLESRSSYVCTTDSSFRVTTDSIYCLASSADSLRTLYHLQRVTLYVLRELRFETAISEEKVLHDWYEHDVCRSFVSPDGERYNNAYLQLYTKLAAGDSLSDQQAMDIIPANEEQYHIYHAGEMLGDSLRMVVMHAIDSAVVAQATVSYALMNQYLQTIQWANDVELKATLLTFKAMDSVNPLLFRQTACYLFTDPNTKFIKDAIEQHPASWYETILADIGVSTQGIKR